MINAPGSIKVYIELREGYTVCFEYIVCPNLCTKNRYLFIAYNLSLTHWFMCAKIPIIEDMRRARDPLTFHGERETSSENRTAEARAFLYPSIVGAKRQAVNIFKRYVANILARSYLALGQR